MIMVLFIFGSGLYFLRLTSDSEIEVKSQIKKDKPKAELPTPPEERWTYIKALESRTVVDQHKNVVNNKKLDAEQRKILAQMASNNNNVSNKAISGSNSKGKTTSQINVGNNFGLQCGAFKTYQQAESQLAKLAMLGINAYIKSSKNWHRVFVGPIGSRTQANVKLNQIRNNVDCLVIAM